MTAPGTQALSPVSAAIRPSIEPLPNFSGSLLARFAAAYDDHAATSSPTPGRMPMNVPMHARAQDRPPVARHVDELRDHRVERIDLHRHRLLAHGDQQLGEPERADQRGHEVDAAGEVAVAEREAVVRVDRLLADASTNRIPSDARRSSP